MADPILNTMCCDIFLLLNKKVEKFQLCLKTAASLFPFSCVTFPIEQHTLKNVNICLNTNICSYLQTSGGQSSNPYLNFVHFFNTRVN